MVKLVEMFFHSPFSFFFLQLNLVKSFENDPHDEIFQARTKFISYLNEGKFLPSSAIGENKSKTAKEN